MVLLPFPLGENVTDTLIGGVHFNLTILRKWGYEYYSNQTISNGSWCMLAFEPHTPKILLENGTFINSTWCYTAVLPIGVRAGVGLGFIVLFALAIVLTLMNLHRHGRLFLPTTKRFYPIGRRWQWYWALATCACALIGLVANIDVDRFYLPELPVVLVSFFWYVMQMCAVAIVWEATRHWGSWMERQFVDPDPFALPADGRDKRGRVELFVPLVFYAFLWLNFFLVVPRNWGPLENQRSPEQTLRDAAPTATDARFKAAVFFLLCAWLTTMASLRHSVKHYQPRNRGLLNRVVGIFVLTPLRLQILLFLCLALVAYQGLAVWVFDYSVLNIKGNVAAIYAGGYAPTVLIIYVQIVAGFLRPNEDLELMRQRRERGVEEDAQLGMTRKPAWWRRARGDAPRAGETMRERVERNVREISGRRPTATAAERAAEMRAGTGAVTASVSAAGGDSSTVEMSPVDRIHSVQSIHSTGTGTGTGTHGGAVDHPGTTVGTTSDNTRSTGPVPAPAPAPAPSARPLVEPYAGRSDRRRTERTMQAVAGILFPTQADSASAAQRRTELMQDGPPPPYDGKKRTLPSGQSRPQDADSRSNSAASINSPPQQVRSMLDV